MPTVAGAGSPWFPEGSRAFPMCMVGRRLYTKTCFIPADRTTTSNPASRVSQWKRRFEYSALPMRLAEGCFHDRACSCFERMRYGTRAVTGLASPGKVIVRVSNAGQGGPASQPSNESILRSGRKSEKRTAFQTRLPVEGRGSLSTKWPTTLECTLLLVYRSQVHDGTGWQCPLPPNGPWIRP